MTDEAPDEVVDYVKSSELRKAIVQVLSDSDPINSDKIIESVQDYSVANPENVKQSLQALHERDVVETSGDADESGLYSLTYFGERITSRIYLDDSTAESTQDSRCDETERPSAATTLDMDDVPVDKASAGHGEWGARRPSWRSDEDRDDVEIRSKRKESYEPSGQSTGVSDLSLVVDKEGSEDRIEALAGELERLLVNSNVSASELESAVKRVLDKYGGDLNE